MIPSSPSPHLNGSENKMFTEENPEAFASPEQKPEAFASPAQKPEDGSKNKKPKKKKKNNQNSAPPNQLPQPQVCSEPLVVVTPNPEIKSNEESSLPKQKRQRKKKSSINAEVAQPNREESKPSLDLEIRKEAEPVGVSVENAETITGKERKKEIGKLHEAVIVENALKHDQDHHQEQLNTVDTEKKTGTELKSELDGSQSNEPGETVVQTSIIDREVPPVDQTIPGNTRPVNLSELENEYLDRKYMKKRSINAQVAQPSREEPKPSFDLEIKKEAKPVGVSVEGAETITGKERKSEIGKLDEVVILENALKHDQDHHQEQLNTVDIEKKRKRNRSELDGSQSNEPGETVVQTSIIVREAPPVDQTILGNTRPVNLSELENEYLDGIWMKRIRNREHKIKEEEKTKERNGKTIVIQVQSPVDPIKKPSTNPAIIMGPHPPEQKTSSKKRKRKGGKALESDRGNAGSTAKTSVQGTKRDKVTKRVKVSNAPYSQHDRSSMICWTCRGTDHTMQQCQKLKDLSKDEEVCFFCGEIGHSLRICSVFKAGGGRLARCLFCNEHGHFSYKCPGNVPDPKVQLPPVEAVKSSAEVTTEKGEEAVKSSAQVTTEKGEVVCLK